MKTVVLLLALVGILAALAGAGFFMLRRPGQDQRKDAMAKALALRVALSVTLFLVILVAWLMGWIEPRGNPLGR
jgi:hypothetical protein